MRGNILATLLGLLVAAGVAVTLTIAFTDNGRPHQLEVKIVFGQSLNENGRQAYQQIKDKATLDAPIAHEDLGSPELETPPPGQVDVDAAAAAIATNEQVAEDTTLGPAHPVPLATREPVTETRLLARNYSSRRGARPALCVVHSTESSNIRGLQDVSAIVAWFNNPASQASSNYTIDAEGNVIRMVPETAKAWTQAFFNPWSVSIEFIGRASQRAWPETQLRAGAMVCAASTARWGIPVRHARVSGCTIRLSGILQHNDLGGCGGGHHDAGPNFPIRTFIQWVGEYRAGGYKPKPRVHSTNTKPSCTPANVRKALHGRSLRPFQHAHGLDADGIIGPLTGRALGLAACHG